MNTYIDYELNNGNTIKLTLNLKRLLNLKTTHKEQYDKANRIITRGAVDIFDMVEIIYTAYLCALESGLDAMPYETFLDVIPQNIDEIIQVVDSLISPKKK